LTVIDGHCHVWPDAIAAQALAGAGAHFQRFGDGTVASLLKAMDEGGVDRAVCLGVAATPERVETANRYAASLTSSRLIGFGSIHPALPLDDNLRTLRANGLCGVKVHPLYQGYALDDPRLLEILRAMQGEFVAVVHVGRGDAGAERCTPRMFRQLALELPSLDLVACHFGGYLLLDEAENEVVGLPNVWLDTSWPPGLATAPRERVLRIIDRHGSERILFASDWPMSEPGRDAETVHALGLSASETAGILGANLHRLIARYDRTIPH
jgi:predicted TIM-barrel fold metal-dependent hydrolase